MLSDDAITLKKLEALLAFLDHGSLALTAEALGQSAVSVHRALHALEQGVGCPLFQRVGRNLVALPAALAFADYARSALAAVAEGARAARSAAGVTEVELNIGALYSLTLRCLPRLMAGLQRRRPDLRLKLTMGSDRELRQALAEGKLDAAVLCVGAAAPPGAWQTVPLFEDRLQLAAPLHSRYANAAPVELEALREEAFVRLVDGFVTTDNFDQAFQQAGFTPRVVLSVAETFSLINLVSGGIGYSLLPGRVAEFSPRLSLLPLAPRYAAFQQVALMFPPSRERDPNLLALAAECRMYRHQPA